MYGYNRSNCYSCAPCNNRNYSRCDCCTAQCCQDNMSSHREIFDLCFNISLSSSFIANNNIFLINNLFKISY